MYQVLKSSPTLATNHDLQQLTSALCLTLRDQLGFLGGRLAIRRALQGMSEAAAAATSAILHNKDGAPVLPKGVSASISHKHHMAVALVQSGCEGHLGARHGFLQLVLLESRSCLMYIA